MSSYKNYKVAFVTSEVVPFAKTGGLADVAGSLPKYISKSGVDVKVFMPMYSSIDFSKCNLTPINSNDNILIRTAAKLYPVKIYRSTLHNSQVEIYFIQNKHFFHRDKIYTEDADEDERFIFFQKAVIETIQRLKWDPDIVHCNDWQTALIPLLLRDNYSWDKLFSKAATLLTIHNVGYQGIFGKATAEKAEIRDEFYKPSGKVELNGNINFLKAGINFADLITTVSKTYSKEILTAEFGHGLETTLQNRIDDIYGIINGVDYSIWNPEVDKNIPFKYSTNNMNGKKLNKKILLTEFGLQFSDDVPVIGIISRLASQKGFDIIEEVLSKIIKLKMRLIILGSGETHYEKMFADLVKKHPRKAAVYLGYNYELAHLVEAGSDMFLMPSHYEPCGLNQIYSLKYGTVPIVRKTGGLADTVIDWNESVAKGKEDGNGFVFSEYSGAALIKALRRALKIFNRKSEWKKIITNGMKCNYSWQKSAEKYIELYDRAYMKRNK